MWSLVPINDAEGGDRLRLLVGKKYTLGRTTADFTINNDKSISRIHAMLEVTHPDTNVSHPHKPPVFTVRDASRFGTVIRNQKFTNSEELVKSGDTIKFGTLNSIYSAVYDPYIVTTSCLDQGSKKQAKLLVSRLGGHVVSDWRRECQLLIMTSLSVTVKVICALVSLKPIVTVLYIEKLVECIEARTALPSAEDYTPPLAESQLNPHEVSFKKDERRKTLFTGKIFIFLNPRQFKKLNVAVELAGGTPMLMEEGTDDNEDDILVAQTTCVMHADPTDAANQLSQNAQEWVKHVFKVLRKHGRRLIPDCELGFAVLYCSTDRYCNPRMDAAPSPNIQSNLSSQTISQQQVALQSIQRMGAQPAARPAAPSVSKSAVKTAVPASTDAKPQVVVKEEPDSQIKPPVIPTQPPTAQLRLPTTPPEANKPRTAPGTSPITKYFSKKRQREDEPNEEGPLSTSKVRRIKEEVEMGRSTRRSPSPCPETSAASSRQARPQRSVSPKTSAHGLSPSPPPPSKRAPIQAARPPSPAITPRTSPRSRSRSPAPAPTRMRVKRRTPSPVPAATVSPKSEPPEEEEVDEFDTYKPRGRRRKARNEDSSSTGNRKDKAPAPVTGSADSNTNTSQRRNSPKRPTVAHKTEAPDPLPQMRRVKEDVDTVVSSLRLPVMEGEQEELDGARRAPSPLPGGFLTTHRTSTGQDGGSGEGAGTVTVVTRLTIPRQQRPAIVTENNNTINEKAVKNFKKFKKVVGVGGRALPRILGGTDLRPHVNDPREVDMWFEEERQTQIERDRQEQEADDMFNWEPKKAAKKKPSARRR